MSNLGKLFKEIRLSKKWSIRQAAKKMGISYSYLSILEKGVDPRTGKDSNPKPETLKMISKAYDYPYEELMKAAGYLSEDVQIQKKFDHDIFVKNILLIMVTWPPKNSRTTYTKRQDIKSSLPDKKLYRRRHWTFSGYNKHSSKYAQVTPDFWYVPNTEESLRKEREKYNEPFWKPPLRPLTKILRRF